MSSVSPPKAQPDLVIRLTAAEIQSGHDRQSWAEHLILQLPASHDGRNSWLLNYGIRGEARSLREKNGHTLNPQSRAINPPAPLPHRLSCLPDCMAPDGADPCAGYHALLAEVEHLKIEVGRRFTADEALAFAARKNASTVGGGWDGS